MPPDNYIPELMKIYDAHVILMIVDDIQAGLCRTGKMFSFEHSGVVPDIITMSKGLGGVGFPDNNAARFLPLLVLTDVLAKKDTDIFIQSVNDIGKNNKPDQ